MTHKDYILIAGAIRETYDKTEFYDGIDGANAIRRFTINLAYALKEDNPDFDGDKFWKAAIGDF